MPLRNFSTAPCGWTRAVPTSIMSHAVRVLQAAALWLCQLYFMVGDERRCRADDGMPAFTVPGSRVVYVCVDRFRRALRAEDSRRGAAHHSRAAPRPGLQGEPAIDRRDQRPRARALRSVTRRTRGRMSLESTGNNWRALYR